MDCISSSSEEEACLFAMQLASAAVMPMVLKSAIELDLLELIKKSGPGVFVSPAELAAQLPTTNPEAHVMLDRILRVLASYSVLNCSLKTLPGGGVERLYALAPVCKFLMKNDDGVSMAPFLLMNHDKVFMQRWYHLKDAVLEGGTPFNRAYGESGFEYSVNDPRFNNVFNQGMSNHSTIIMKKITEIYNGVEHVGGDMFVSVPKGDAIFMKWIIHDWSDELCLELLKNCYKSLPENGKVILVEVILTEAPGCYFLPFFFLLKYC